MKEITFEQLLEKFHESTHERFRGFRDDLGNTYIVLFENQMFDSSAFGERTAVAVGPDKTYKTLADVANGWLNDLPSQRQYPIAYVELRQDLGSLTGKYKVVDAFNGLYVYHLPTGRCQGAGDGSETTLDDLLELARTDPVTFEEAYGPPPEDDGEVG